MELAAWIRAFRSLHEQARKGDLSASETVIYHGQREELARALVVAQRLTTLPGQTARQSLRVARALQLDLDLDEGRQRVMTMHLSTGGFGTLLQKSPAVGAAIGFSLRLPGSTELLVGRARVVDAHKRVGNSLVSFAFEPLPDAAREQLELCLFDTVLQQFQGVSA